MTYPALCKLISEDAKSGKARELHIKKLSQYINIDRESAPRKLIVREVYLPESFKLNKPRGKIYPYMKDVFLELFQKKKTERDVIFSFCHHISLNDVHRTHQTSNHPAVDQRGILPADLKRFFQHQNWMQDAPAFSNLESG